MIHLLNGQHTRRAEASPYERHVPDSRDRSGHGERRDHRDGGRGRLRPRRRLRSRAYSRSRA
ncbi:hypothetical protein [Streptomyces syringium]|uniref:hypothetical protein n=1 Tax=Streptomyces syringium TaxID=76729 RepID=UPI003441E5E5